MIEERRRRIASIISLLLISTCFVLLGFYGWEVCFWIGGFIWGVSVGWSLNKSHQEDKRAKTRTYIKNAENIIDK